MRILFYFGAVGAVAVCVYFFTSASTARRGAVATEMLYTVQRGKLNVTITENGSLMAKNSEKITFMGRRGGKVAFLIEEGKSVAQDEVLCRLETKELETQQQQLKLDINKTEADLSSAKTELDIQQSDNIAAVEKAKIALAKAENEMEKYRDGDAPKERRNFEVAIKVAETAHSKSKKKYEDSQKLLEQSYINKSQLEQDQIDFEQCEIKLKSAEKDLELFEKYTLPMTMTDKDSAVKDGERGKENAEKRATSQLRQKQVAVESQEQRLRELQKNLKEVEEEIEKSTIKAPCPGIVLYGDPAQPWYRDEIKLGGQVWGGFTLFTIPDLRVMQVQVQIHEADINKIKVDQGTTVTMDTYPGLVLKGKVAKIASIAGGGGRNWRQNDEVKKFTVDVILDGTGEVVLKPGISAKAEIFVAEREGVLSVPRQCVFNEEGEFFAYVMKSDRPEKVRVKTDISNDASIQIAEGLSEGDRVLLYNPSLGSGSGPGTTAGTQSQPARPAAPVLTRAQSAAAP